MFYWYNISAIQNRNQENKISCKNISVSVLLCNISVVLVSKKAHARISVQIIN